MDILLHQWRYKFSGIHTQKYQLRITVLPSGFREIMNSPKNTRAPLIKISSKPISKFPKMNFWYLSMKKQIAGAAKVTTGTHLSLTCLRVRMPKENRPSKGP